MDDFIRRMLEQQEMVKRFKEGPAKFVPDNEAIITRMQGLEHMMHTSNIERAVAMGNVGGLTQQLPALIDSTVAAFAKLTTPDFTKAMDHYARGQQQMYKDDRAPCPAEQELD